MSSIATEKIRRVTLKIICMKKLIIFISLFTSFSVAAIECESVLIRFTSILTEQGELAENNNVSDIEFDDEKFKTCEVTHKDKNHTLWLHSDNVSIYISSKLFNSDKNIVQGPFYSAYKK